MRILGGCLILDQKKNHEHDVVGTHGSHDWDLIINVCIDIYVMMSSDLYGTCRHCLYGTLSVRSSVDIIVIGNVATVTSQLLLHHARCCIGCKWPMDQMYSKCEIHCFLHDLQKISKLRNFRKFSNFRKFPKKSFLFFFIEYFFDKMFFWQLFFKEFFIVFKTITLY